MNLWGSPEALRITFPWLTVFSAALAVVMLLQPGSLGLLTFDRSAVYQGEWWRLITAHWVHSSVSHGAWDIIVLFCVGAWFEQFSRYELGITLILGGVSVDLLLLWVDLDLAYYCGLSGILFAPLTLLALRHWWQERRWIAFLPVCFILLKLIWETFNQSTLLVETAWGAYPQAHWAGVVAGCTYWLISMSALYSRISFNTRGQVEVR